MSQSGVDLDRIRRFHAEALGPIAVARLDAAFGIEAVAAHVPFSDGTIGARNRIRTPNDSNDEVTAGETGIVWRLEHAADGFMSDDESISARGRPPVPTRYDLGIGTTDPDREGVYQQATRLDRWLRDVPETHRTGLPGCYHECTHAQPAAFAGAFQAIAVFSRNRP